MSSAAVSRSPRQNLNKSGVCGVNGPPFNRGGVVPGRPGKNRMKGERDVKIAVTAIAASLDAEVDPRFGRCPCFLVVETDDLSFEPIDNQNVTLGGGAGIQSAQLMAEKGVQYVLTGNCGPNAYRTLSAAGISVIVGCSGSVRQAVEKFKSGAYSVADQPSVGGHFGMGGGGAGRGMGRGMAAREATVQGAPITAPSASQPRQQSELEQLRQQANQIGQQLQAVLDRIQKLESEGQR